MVDYVKLRLPDVILVTGFPRNGAVIRVIWSLFDRNCQLQCTLETRIGTFCNQKGNTPCFVFGKTGKNEGRHGRSSVCFTIRPNDGGRMGAGGSCLFVFLHVVNCLYRPLLGGRRQRGRGTNLGNGTLSPTKSSYRPPKSDFPMPGPNPAQRCQPGMAALRSHFWRHAWMCGG